MLPDGFAIAFTALCLTKIIGVFFTSLLLGPADLTASQLIKGLLGREDVNRAIWLVIYEVRLPRTLLVLFIGASLGASGAALQGYLRNPLAETGLIGVSSGASLGAVLAFYSGLSATYALAIPLSGIAGAFSAVLAVYFLAGKHNSPLTLILSGVVVSAFAGALTSLALSMYSNPFAIMEIVFWMMGSLADRSLIHLYLAAPFILIGRALIWSLGRDLDGMSLGEEVAHSLGVDLKRVQTRLVCGIALSVGAATSVAGAIGFVGLVAPHILRPFSGGHPSKLITLSIFGGAVFMLSADCAVRIFTPGHELKLGVLTSLIGAPFFLILVLKMRRELAA
jgi:iron complex transport system permease protein